MLRFIGVRMIVNLESLEELAGDDKSFLQDIVQTFFREIPLFCERVREFMLNGEYDLMAREVHKARSTVLPFGLTELSEKLREFEKLIASGEQKASYPAMLAEIKGECFRALGELEQLLPKL